MVILTALISTICIIASWNIVKQVKGYFVLFLLLETGMMGTFVALDFFLFFVFWELMLLPMYFLIGIYGYGRRIYAAVKFFIFTLVGSVLMLMGVLYLYYQADQSFLLSSWMDLDLAVKTQLILFTVFSLSFAIKVPIIPLHTWLPDAHTEAPTAGSVILAGVLLKMGTYGFVRFAMPLFPDGLFLARPYLVTLAVIGISRKRAMAFMAACYFGCLRRGLARIDRMSAVRFSPT